MAKLLKLKNIVITYNFENGDVVKSVVDEYRAGKFLASEVGDIMGNCVGLTDKFVDSLKGVVVQDGLFDDAKKTVEEKPAENPEKTA